MASATKGSLAWTATALPIAWKPISNKASKDRWQHLVTIADTVKDEELLTLNADTLLYRLYHQDAVRLFDAKPLIARCQCSRERVERH